MRVLAPILLLSVGIVVLFVLLANRRDRSARELQLQNDWLTAENEQHREFLDNLHELLLEHQELDPSLSTIALDELRQHRRALRDRAHNRRDLP